MLPVNQKCPRLRKLPVLVEPGIKETKTRAKRRGTSVSAVIPCEIKANPNQHAQHKHSILQLAAEPVVVVPEALELAFHLLQGCIVQITKSFKRSAHLHGREGRNSPSFTLAHLLDGRLLLPHRPVVPKLPLLRANEAGAQKGRKMRRKGWRDGQGTEVAKGLGSSTLRPALFPFPIRAAEGSGSF